MGLFDSIKNIAKDVVNPVGAGIEKLTGISQIDQLKTGALLGSGAAAFHALSGGAAGGVGSDTNSAGAGSSGSGLGQFGFGSLLPSVIGVAGDIYSANRTAQGQQDANQLNLQTAREQMAFQERMSNTASLS